MNTTIQPLTDEQLNNVTGGAGLSQSTIEMLKVMINKIITQKKELKNEQKD